MIRVPRIVPEASARTVSHGASGSDADPRHASRSAAAARLLVEGQANGQTNRSSPKAASEGKRAAPYNRAWFARRACLLSVLAIALFIGQLPMLLAACCAPEGATGLGTVWF